MGGGDAAVEEADYLTRYAEKVYLVHRRGELRASKILQERLFRNPKIEMVWNKRVLELFGDPSGLKTMALEDTENGQLSELKVTGCFVFIGFRPNSGIVQEHFAHDASGYMITDDRMMTSIPGLFAAGDLRVQLTRQVTTAVGDATTAAIAVEKYLTERRQAGRSCWRGSPRRCLSWWWGSSPMAALSRTVTCLATRRHARRCSSIPARILVSCLRR